VALCEYASPVTMPASHTGVVIASHNTLPSDRVCAVTFTIPQGQSLVYTFTELSLGTSCTAGTDRVYTWDSVYQNNHTWCQRSDSRMDNVKSYADAPTRSLVITLITHEGNKQNKGFELFYAGKEDVRGA